MNLYVLMVVFSISFLHAAPNQVIIIRHAEKLPLPNPGPYLSREGVLRSLTLPSYFEKNYAVPKALFAPEPHSSIRPTLTIAPTANHFASLYPELVNNFTINFAYETPKDLAKHILSEKTYQEQTLIICWVHQEIQAIAKALGVDKPPKWHGKDFSSVWVIDFNADGTVKSFVITAQE